MKEAADQLLEAIAAAVRKGNMPDVQEWRDIVACGLMLRAALGARRMSAIKNGGSWEESTKETTI